MSIKDISKKREQDLNNTQEYRRKADMQSSRDCLLTVHGALKEKGYNPVSQIVGYLLSGDPTYVTSYNDARYLITTFERDELLEEVVGFYIKHNTECCHEDSVKEKE